MKKWEAVFGTDGAAIVNDAGTVAMVPIDLSAWKEHAHLIKAAPELLEACRASLEWAKAPGNHGGNPYTKRFVMLSKRAIAKAEIN